MTARYVRVRYGDRIGQAATVVERHREPGQMVYRSGLVFAGPTGYVGRERGREWYVVEFPDGERRTYEPHEVESVVRVEM